MPPPFTIQPLTNAHATQIVDLILPIQQQEFNVPIDIASQPDLLDIETAYFRNGGHFWGAIGDGAIGDGAISNDRLLGTIALISIGHQAGALRKMFVRKECRGKEPGVAQHLMEALLSYCVSADISTVYLGTIQTMKAAHRFYERNGFRTIEKADLPDYYPNMATDNLYYYRTITKHAFL